MRLILSHQSSNLLHMSKLSKSKIIAYRQCPKRLWLEIHKKEERDDTASQSVFEIGRQVGEIAQSIYDPNQAGEMIDIHVLGHQGALERSKELLNAGTKPIFEAGFTSEGALAYADVMIPENRDDVPTWKMIEVKSSTSLKDYYREDIAIQTCIAEAAGIKLSSVSIANIDNSFVYQGDGNYQGLFKETDLTAEAKSRSNEARQWIATAHEVAALSSEPDIATGDHCSSPFPCGFLAYCNKGKVFPEFSLDCLPRLHKKKRQLIEEDGHEDLRDVPDELLNKLQNRVKECSSTGETFFDAKGAAKDLAPHGFPAYFLDFETAMFAVPIWKGTRPFQQLPFQFSLHIVQENDDLTHHEFLNLSGEDPSYACAAALVRNLGESGPVFAYNAGFECGVMRKLGERFPEFRASLEAIVSRVVDLLPVARSRYYHPSQKGSWSIKKVLPAAIPDLSYDQLDGVKDGGNAVAAFMEAIQVNTPADRKAEIHQQLSAYCLLDTLAMVRLWKFFRGFA